MEGNNDKNNLGPLRRNSLLGPYGVGAIVPFPEDETYMVAGLDAWRYNDPGDFRVNDERLQKWLRVNELRLPPDYRKKNADAKNSFLTIPMVRFPGWYYCPFCGEMKHAGLSSSRPTCDSHKWETGRSCKKNAHTKMIPERFVVVCPQGHIDDFPVAEWVHFNSGHKYDPKTCIIRRSTGSASSGLQGVVYECTCGAKRSMAGAFSKGALASIGYKCRGSKPWLGIIDDKDHPCLTETSTPVGIEDGADDGEKVDNSPRVLLRGATNAWFASVKSSIYIPSEDSPAQKKLEKVVDDIEPTFRTNSLKPELIESLIQAFAKSNDLNADDLYRALMERLKPADVGKDTERQLSENEYRFTEYQALIRTYGDENEDFRSDNVPIEKYAEVIRPYFKSISLVRRLRETRAFTGFSRLKPDAISPSAKRKLLRLGNENWLPAIMTFGEGVFFEFSDSQIENWLMTEGVAERISKLDVPFKDSYLSRDEVTCGSAHLKPEYVMIHTFAHLLINQLSYDCGYGSSSLRERIYCEKMDDSSKMHGVLIYTSSGDSEGSMGGLVRQGEPGRLENTILRAIHNAEWCSADPVCIQSDGQGPDSMNLAACHNCALLPETCCEVGNRLLDRGVIVGTLDDKKLGYFHGMLKVE